MNTEIILTESPDVKNRVYWKSPIGIEHGLILNRKSSENFEVYSYSTGNTTVVKKTAIQKVVKEVV